MVGIKLCNRKIIVLSVLFVVFSSFAVQVSGRQYNPHTRRFMQPDTIIPNPYNPQSLNRYSYAYNNPMAYTDPTGHEPVKAEAGEIDKVQTKVNEIIASA